VTGLLSLVSGYTVYMMALQAKAISLNVLSNFEVYRRSIRTINFYKIEDIRSVVNAGLIEWWPIANTNNNRRPNNETGDFTAVPVIFRDFRIRESPSAALFKWAIWEECHAVVGIALNHIISVSANLISVLCWIGDPCEIGVYGQCLNHCCQRRGMSSIQQPKLQVDISSIDVKVERAVYADFRLHPRTFGQFQLTRGSVSTALGSVGGLFGFAVHKIREIGVDSEAKKSEHFNNKDRYLKATATPLAGFFFVGWGWWRIRFRWYGVWSFILGICSFIIGAILWAYSIPSLLDWSA